MRPPDRKNISSGVTVALFVCVLVAFTALPECGSGVPPTRFLAVSDSGNNRVLIYSELEKGAS